MLNVVNFGERKLQDIYLNFSTPEISNLKDVDFSLGYEWLQTHFFFPFYRQKHTNLRGFFFLIQSNRPLGRFIWFSTNLSCLEFTRLRSLVHACVCVTSLILSLWTICYVTVDLPCIYFDCYVPFLCSLVLIIENFVSSFCYAVAFFFIFAIIHCYVIPLM